MKVGHAFGDHIKTEKLRKRNSSEGGALLHVRFLLIVLVVSLGSVLLLVTLVRLQLLNGKYYRVLADSNRTKTKIIYAPRGIITDRNNVPLVLNTPGFRIVKNNKSEFLSKEKALSLLAKEGDNVLVDSLREYPYKEATAHLIGYIGQIPEEELKKERESEYLLTDLIGKEGIEERYEETLRGVHGKQLVEIDATGKVLRTLGGTDPIPGNDVMLTLDASLQQRTYEAMAHVKKGVAIAATVDGEILTMVSKPSFDPNIFTLTSEYKASSSGYQTVEAMLSDNDGQPLLNRAISGVYPPGSTFKLVTAAAGLENKLIDKDYTVEDTGVLRVGEFSFANWFFLEQGKKDGVVNVVKGIARSNDIFFYKLAEKIGVSRLSKSAEKFGVGKPLGIDLTGEAKGTLPTPDWKKTAMGESWYLGDTYHYGIGQGYLLTTPLQVNAWTQVIANGGWLYEPRLLNAQSAPLRQSSEGQEKRKTQNFLSKNTIALITEGMVDSCEPGGVAYPLFEFKVKNEKLKVDGKNFIAVDASSSAGLKNAVHIPVACKTGTAQHGGEETPPHAWITLFAPAYDPEIVITVLVESGGQGSTVAAPIARDMLRAWFEKK